MPSRQLAHRQTRSSRAAVRLADSQGIPVKELMHYTKTFRITCFSSATRTRCITPVIENADVGLFNPKSAEKQAQRGGLFAQRYTRSGRGIFINRGRVSAY